MWLVMFYVLATVPRPVMASGARLGSTIGISGGRMTGFANFSRLATTISSSAVSLVLSLLSFVRPGHSNSNSGR